MKAQVMGPQSDIETGAQTVTQFGPTMGMSEDEFLGLVASTLIMIPHRTTDGISAGLAQSMGAWARFGATVATIVDEFGGFIEITRSNMVRTFLEYCASHPQIDKLVMIDNDENIPWDAPYRLAQWDLPVVSGVVCNYNETRGVFACFTVKDEHGVARFPSYNFTKTMPGKGLIKVHSVGTGLICIKKVVFEKIYDSGQYPFYIPEATRLNAAQTGLLAWGEDIAFSRQCEDLGFDRHVDLSIQAVHYKIMPVSWPKGALDWDIDPQDWKVSPRDYRHG